MMPDLETGDMIGLVSSTGPGLVTEINDPRQLLLLDFNESLLPQIVKVTRRLGTLCHV